MIKFISPAIGALKDMQSEFTGSIISHQDSIKYLLLKHTRTRYIHGSRLREDVCVDVHHQVASCCVLHNKTHVLRSLEARKQVDQEGMVRQVHDLKDALLAH